MPEQRPNTTKRSFLNALDFLYKLTVYNTFQDNLKTYFFIDLFQIL